jgi:hypothetical protein
MPRTELLVSKNGVFENEYDLHRAEIRKRWNANGYS